MTASMKDSMNTGSNEMEMMIYMDVSLIIEL
jgi:hypothetical protein